MTSFRNRQNRLSRRRCLAFALLLLLASGCGAVRRAQVRGIAQIFSGPSESNVFAQDDDPELIRDAFPFALKTYEALLASDPENRDLTLTAAEGFVTYANAFVQVEAERLEERDLHRAQDLRKRAARLYLRGRDYALAGLSLDHADFEKRLRQDAKQVLHELSPRDVPLLYWAAAGWGGAVSSDPSNMSLVAELSTVEAMMRRALELDEDFDNGAVHEFFIAYEGGRSEAMGGSTERAREHFDRVLTLTQGKKASPYVSLASSVAIRKQDYKMFKDLLHKALEIDTDAVPKWRLSNTLAQEKAQWLLDHSPELFLEYDEEPES
jgi:predicted anti-sigma-YlaC factor YlaD